MDIDYKYLLKENQNGRGYIPLTYSYKTLPINNINELYNIDDYDNIGSLKLMQTRNTNIDLMKNEIILPKNIEYLYLTMIDDYIKYIKFPAKLDVLEVFIWNNFDFDIDIDCDIKKIIIKRVHNKINKFPKKTEIISIESHHRSYDTRSLRSIPDILPINLRYLDIARGLLTKLPELPDTLEYLLCDSNELTELPKLPPNLVELICFNNKLKSLPELPKSLCYLNCSQNNIDDLPLSLLYCKMSEKLHYCNLSINRCFRPSETSMHWLSNCKCGYSNRKHTYFGFIYQDNPIYNTIINKYKFRDRNARRVKRYLYHKKVKPYVLIIENWFLECKYNPKYKYCRDRLRNEFKELYS